MACMCLPDGSDPVWLQANRLSCLLLLCGVPETQLDPISGVCIESGIASWHIFPEIRALDPTIPYHIPLVWEGLPQTRSNSTN